MTLEARVFLYFSIDIDLAWRPAARGLPELGQRLRTILKELE